MADAAVRFFLNKFDNLLSREWGLLRRIENEVGGLKHEFEAIGALLKDADTKGRSSEQVEVWIKQVRDLAYEMEDVFDMLALNMAQQSNLFPELLREGVEFVTKLKRRHSIASLIEDINKKLRRAKERRESYHGISPSHASTSVRDESRNHFAPLYIAEADVVGLQKPRDKLIAWVEQGEPKLKVMFVVGMVGLGKTTLVRQAYAKMKAAFDCYAWITISKFGRKKELLQTMAKEFFWSIQQPIPKEFDNGNEVQLMDKLQGFLQHKMYVIVLDDLWSESVWNSIKSALPNQTHSRIIITTQRGDIAHFCSRGSVTVNLKPLPLQKAQKLFYNKTFPSNRECPSGLVEWSNKILKICDGLPLGIVAIGNLLSKTEKTVDAWKKLHDGLGSELEKNDHLSSIKRVVCVCYKNLPFHLRYCFLYLSIFPEDYSIKRRRLIRLWISEGLVKEVRGKTLEEVGEDYLKELIYRNLVMVNEVDFDGRAKTCRLHALVHKIILCKSQEESFCRVSTEPEISFGEKIRRLSIHKSWPNMSEKNFPSVRTFFMFGIEKLSHSASQFLSSFSILKVLDLEDAPLDKFRTAITELLLLRYLSLRNNTNISKLPKSLGKLKNLGTLDLKQTSVTELPNEILKLDKLRHLLVNYRNSTNNYVTFESIQGFKASAKIENLKALQKLSFIKANKNDGVIKALGNLTQLRKLGIITLEEEDGKHLCHSIEGMKDLRSFDVTSIREEVFLDLNAISTPPRLLQRLHLKGRLRKLPDWISTLHDLVRIGLKWSKLRSTNPIDALEDLPHLMELQLFDAFTGNRLVFYPSKFQNLKILRVENLEALEVVTIGKGALPCLKKLIIRRCKKLKLVPEGIDKLTQLKEFHLYDMPEEFVNRLQRNGGKYRHLVLHIPLICSYSPQSRGNWRLTHLS